MVPNPGIAPLEPSIILKHCSSSAVSQSKSRDRRDFYVCSQMNPQHPEPYTNTVHCRRKRGTGLREGQGCWCEDERAAGDPVLSTTARATAWRWSRSPGPVSARWGDPSLLLTSGHSPGPRLAQGHRRKGRLSKTTLLEWAPGDYCPGTSWSSHPSELGPGFLCVLCWVGLGAEWGEVSSGNAGNHSGHLQEPWIKRRASPVDHMLWVSCSPGVRWEQGPSLGRQLG